MSHPTKHSVGSEESGAAARDAGLSRVIRRHARNSSLPQRFRWDNRSVTARIAPGLWPRPDMAAADLQPPAGLALDRPTAEHGAREDVFGIRCSRVCQRVSAAGEEAGAAENRHRAVLG
jgi:hypothetical protein